MIEGKEDRKWRPIKDRKLLKKKKMQS